MSTVAIWLMKATGLSDEVQSLALPGAQLWQLLFSHIQHVSESFADF